MKITAVKVFELEGPPRSGLALYETVRSGLSPNQITPYRNLYTEIETNEELTGLSYGGSAEVIALGERLIGEDPLRVEYIWDKIYTGSYYRGQNLNALSILDLALWDLIGKAKGEP